MSLSPYRGKVLTKPDCQKRTLPPHTRIVVVI